MFFLLTEQTRHNYPGAVDPHLRVHRVRHTADLRHHPRQRPDDHPGQSSDERMMPCCTRDTDTLHMTGTHTQ